MAQLLHRLVDVDPALFDLFQQLSQFFGLNGWFSPKITSWFCYG